MPENEYYLQFFLAEKSASGGEVSEIDDVPTIDRTFYLDAMGTATALISTLKEEIYYLKIHIERQNSDFVTIDTIRDNYWILIAKKEAEISHNLEVIQKLDAKLAEKTAELSQLRQSNSWRLTYPFRRIAGKFRIPR